MHSKAHWPILAISTWILMACESSTDTESIDGKGGGTQVDTAGASSGGNSSGPGTASGGTSSHAHHTTAPAGGTASVGGMMGHVGGMMGHVGGMMMGMSHAGAGTSMAGSTAMVAGNAGAAPQGAILKAPVIVSVSPMGGLHVAWTNQTTDCEKIELLRNKDGGAYALAYVLTGAATSQHDSQATAPGTYCYRARCIIRVHSSAESAELCATLR